MTTLRDVMTKELVTVPPELSIRDAMALLSSRHISGAPVMAGGKIVGVVSATDLMAFAAELPGAPAEPDEYVEQGELVAREGADDDARELEPSGTYYTELWDDAGADATLRFATHAGPEWNVLEEHTVEEAMTRAPICALSADTELTAAAEYMRGRGIHRILVTEGDRLVGIATSTDLANAIADGKLRGREYVFANAIDRGAQVRGKRAHPETLLGDHLPRREKPNEQ